MTRPPDQCAATFPGAPATRPASGGPIRRRAGRHGALRTLMRDPVTLIVGDGAVWTTVAAPQDPAVMAPIAAWLWVGLLFVIRRATTARERPRR